MTDFVYGIFTGEYSDWEVLGVSYDEKIAESYAKLKDGYVLHIPIITDQTFIEKAEKMIDVTIVRIHRCGYSTDFGEIIKQKQIDREVVDDLCKEPLILSSGRYSMQKIYEFFIKTNDVKKAKKIALERMNKIICEEIERR